MISWIVALHHKTQKQYTSYELSQPHNTVMHTLRAYFTEIVCSRIVSELCVKEKKMMFK